MIPIAKPLLDRQEVRAVKNVILSGWVSQGPKVKQFEGVFASYVGAKYACATSSCTAALHIALKTVGVEPGDIVITVSHSFIATANSIRHCGAEPLFIDIDPGAFNMSPRCLEECLKEHCKVQNSSLRAGSGRVSAILLVHQMGMPCDLNAILTLARKFNLPVVEDAACAIGSEISFDGGKTWEKIGKPHGDIACFSFHPRKIITTGDGGMLTTNHPEYDGKFRLLRHQGMSISDRERHASKKVVFEEYPIIGYNYRLTDIQSAIGIEQLKKLPAMVKERRKLALLYRKKLKDIPWLKLPFEPAYCKTNWQSYPVRVLEGAPLSRDKLMQYLLNRNVSNRRGVMNAHQERPYLSKASLKNSESARDSVILLPMFNGIKEKQIAKVAMLLKNA